MVRRRWWCHSHEVKEMTAYRSSLQITLGAVGGCNHSKTIHLTALLNATGEV